jgi:hypothetical protein
MNLDDILSLAPKPSDREELLKLAREYYDISISNPGPDQGAPQNELLDRLMKTIQRHVSVARFPIPTPQELAQMISNHFQ